MKKIWVREELNSRHVGFLSGILKGEEEKERECRERLQYLAKIMKNLGCGTFREVKNWH